MYKTGVTLDDVFRLALPPDTKLLVGEDLLDRTVSWACSLRPSPPAFPKLDGNELALIDLEDLRSGEKEHFEYPEGTRTFVQHINKNKEPLHPKPVRNQST